MSIPKIGQVKTVGKLSLAAFLAAQFTYTVHAQDQNTDDEDVYILSPFEVNASGNVGYMATSSLAGTRLKTELRDVAAAITVVTSEFLQDTGSTNLEDLLVYTTNTEIGGLSGNFGGDPAATRRAPDRQTRIRGLDKADVTRNFFLTDIPFDTYNVSQVDISRGANSVLFGLGSPAGIINYNLKTPNMQKSIRTVELRMGEHGSTRASIDVDQVVYDNLLGVRFAGVQDNKRFSQEYAKDDATRGYLVVRYTPKIADEIYTEIQATYEDGKVRANRPSSEPPYDYISNWYTHLNKFTNELGTWPDYSVATIPEYGPYLANYQAGPGGNWFDSMGVIYANPNSPEAGVGVADLIAFRQRGGPDDAGGSWLAPSNAGNPSSGHRASDHYLSDRASFVNNPKAMAIIEAYEAATGKVWNGGWGWTDTQISDPSIFNFYNEMLAGPNNTQFSDFDATSITLRQTFFSSLFGYEVAYGKEHYDDGETILVNTDRLAIDINERLRDNTTANPNFGRAVIVGGNKADVTEREREDWRVTAFANVNFSDIFRVNNWLTTILGHHTFTGMMAEQKYEQLSYDYALYKMDSTYTLDITNSSGLDGVHYLNSEADLKSATSINNAGIHGLDAKHTPPSSMYALYFGDNLDGKGIAYGNVGVISYKDDIDNMYGTGAKAYKTANKSQAFIWQSWFLDDTVVGIWSIRKDDYKLTDKPRVPEISYGNQSVGAPFDPTWSWNEAPSIEKSQTKTSWGLMLHTPKFIKKHLPWGTDISLGYNKSSNFQPGQMGMDIYKNQYPAPAGETEDYSILFSTLEGKVNLRVTKFESIQANSEISGLSTWSVKNRLSRAMNGLMVEAWGATGSGSSGRAQTTPEAVVNKWFFGSSYDSSLASNPLPTGWTVQNHPELLSQPLRLRAAADPDSPTYVTEGMLKEDGTAYTEPPITAEEAEYRRAWFAARSDEEWARPFGMELFNSLEFIRDYSYWGGIWRDNTPSNMKGIGDNIAKGWELELTVNPTENWRLMANVTKTETTTGNVWKDIGTYIDNFAPVALDGWDRSIQAGDPIDYWHREGFSSIDAWGNNGTQMLGWDWFNDVQKAYLVKKEGEGKSVSQLRKWSASLVTTYSFSNGMLKGLDVGSSVRWQDKGIIGFYPKYLSDLQVWIDDLDSPIYSSAQTNVDLWIGYEHALPNNIDWRIQLNVRNAFSDDKLVAIQSNPDGSFAKYRIASGRTWEITSAFTF